MHLATRILKFSWKGLLCMKFFKSQYKCATGVSILYLKINCTWFWYSFFFKEYLNRKVRIKIVNENKVDYHPKASRLTLTIYILSYVYRPFTAFSSFHIVESNFFHKNICKKTFGQAEKSTLSQSGYSWQGLHPWWGSFSSTQTQNNCMYQCGAPPPPHLWV